MKIADMPGERGHVLVWYKRRAVRFTFSLGTGGWEHRVRRMKRLCELALREARREALQVPIGVIPNREDGDAVFTVGVDPLPLPDGVQEVWL